MDLTELPISEVLVGLENLSVKEIPDIPFKNKKKSSNEIRLNLIKNWVNEHLKKTSGRLDIDFGEDFCDGMHLTALVEYFTKIKLIIWQPRTDDQHQLLQVSYALEAFRDDGVNLTDINEIDIVNGNVKVILRLITTLIIHYQIYNFTSEPKKFMLLWLKAVLPECKINNLTTDWNSGVNLSALLDYCKPGLFPKWRELDPTNCVENCRTAMEIAEKEFNIPLLLEPEHLASEHLNEFSFMVYFSYFINPNSPGAHMTLEWVNSILTHAPVQNFTTNWNDGRALCGMVKNLGGSAPLHREIIPEYNNWTKTIQLGLDGAKELGIEETIEVETMKNQTGSKFNEHLNVMAYVAQFKLVEPRSQNSEQSDVNRSLGIKFYIPTNLKYTEKEVPVKIVFGDEIDPDKIEYNVFHSNPVIEKWWKENSKTIVRRENEPFIITFVPRIMGMHVLTISYDKEFVQGCPYYFRVAPTVTREVIEERTGYSPCGTCDIFRIGELFQTTPGDVMEAPQEGYTLCCLKRDENTYQFDKVGTWLRKMIGEKKKAEKLTVCNPNRIKWTVLKPIHNYLLSFPPLYLEIDISETIESSIVNIDVVRGNRSTHVVQEHIQNEMLRKFRIRAQDKFGHGPYRIYIYSNGIDIPFSPFLLAQPVDEKLILLEQEMTELNIYQEEE